MSGKKVALVLFGTNFDYFVYIGASAKKTAEEAIKYLESLDEINGEVICLNCPEGETMNSRARGFMDTIAARFPELTVNEQKLGATDSTAEDAQTYVDNKLHIPENIELFYIPPYTPEMNPIEQIWKELRITGFRNEVFATLEKVVDRLCDTICTLTSDTIKNITRCSWIINCFN